MANPEYLLCDADALIQVFLTRQVQLLVALRTKYGVKAAIVPEVESEVRFNQRYKNQYENSLLKQLSSGNVTVLDTDRSRHLLRDRELPEGEIPGFVERVRGRGLEYNKYVHEGEAYSHAVATLLQLPLLSNDREALEALEHAGLPVSLPVLRFFDLIAFGVSESIITAEDGQRARSLLMGAKHEFLSYPFKEKKASFSECLSKFSARLHAWRKSGTPPHPRGPRDVIYFVPL